MGVATLITVMTLVQGANLYVEQKIANLGTNVFRVGRLPFAVTDFALLTRAQRHKFLYPDDMEAIAAGCAHCQSVDAALDASVTLRYADHQLDDSTLHGHTPTMAEIDTRTVDLGRYFTDVEDRHAAFVCLIGDRVSQEFFAGVNPLGRAIRAGAIGSIGLLVGGIGVMNIMLISVTERTGGIGIRKAIGARKSDIRAQFLLEAVMLSGIGGMLGILVGAVISMTARALASIPATVSPFWVAMGVAISVGVGLFFGYYPANRARQSRPNSLLALRIGFLPARNCYNPV